MATTSVGSDRQSDVAIQRYTDALFVRDNKKLFFGNDGDVSFEYDADGNAVLNTAGADIRISDTQLLAWGDDADFSLASIGSKAVGAGTLDLSDVTTLLPVPALRTLSGTIDYSDFKTGNSGAASNATSVKIIVSDITIPVNSIVYGTQVAVTRGFHPAANADSVGMSVGTTANSDAWTGGVSDLNVFQSDLDCGAAAQAGLVSYTSAATKCYANINIHSGGVQSDLTRGKAVVKVIFAKL